MSILPATPSRINSAAARAELLQNSPHYTTTRRHSLYGTEDRIIIDPGSRLWKVGFSGEGRPRDVFLVKTPAMLAGSTMPKPEEREENERLAEHQLQEQFRRVFFDSLLSDPKSRKVIILEGPLVPLTLKDMMARVLFRNLQVPSISFAPSHMLSILAAGRVNGLVLDCGHLESTVLPIYASQPLFANLKSTPLAGSRLTAHLRSLLLLFGVYHRPRNFRPSAGPPEAARIPEEVLTDDVVEDIKTRCCFVGSIIDASIQPDDAMDVDVPLVEGAPSETGRSSRMSMATDEQSTSAASGFSSASIPPAEYSKTKLEALASHYKSHSTASDVSLRVVPPLAHITEASTGPQARGTIVIPGWVRERAAEMLFAGGDVDERSVVEVILDALLKVPVDLRKDLASTILVVGGTPMLPGFIPRLHAELLKALTIIPPPVPQDPRSTPTPMETSSPPQTPTAATHAWRAPALPPQPSRRPPYNPYVVLHSLAPHIAILNNPSPSHVAEASAQARSNAGKAPAFTSALMPWIGGSLTGALKIGAEELPRERWDEAYERESKEQQLEALVAESSNEGRGPPEPPAANGRRPPAFTYLPDWTRVPLSSGAPAAASARAVYVQLGTA